MRTLDTSRRLQPAVAAVITIILGLAAGMVLGTAGIMHLVLSEPLPYVEPDRLVDVSADRPEALSEVSVPEYRHFKEVLDSLEHLAVYQDWSDTYEDGESNRLVLSSVSPNFFSMLGVSPLVGRLWEDGERWPSAGIVLGHDYFLRRFGGDPQAIGTSIRLNGIQVRVLGAMPPRFLHVTGRHVDAWTAWVPTGGSTNRRFRMIGRVKRDASAEAVQAQLDSVWRAGGRGAGVTRFRAQKLHQAMTRYIAHVLAPLTFGVIAVACLALGTAVMLLRIRTTLRLRDRALRVAFGATPRHLLREAASRAGIAGGAAASLAVAAALLTERSLIVALGDALASLRDRPPATDLVLGLLAGITAFGAVFLCHAAGGDFGWRISGQPGAAMHVPVKWPLKLWTTLQISLSCALIVASVVAWQALRKLAADDLGFQTRDLAMMHVRVPLARYQNRAAIELISGLLDDLRHHPAVRSAAATSTAPLDEAPGVQKSTPVLRTELAPDLSAPWINTVVVSEDYFRTVGQPLLHGRDFRREDRDQSFVILSRATATRLWGRADVVGEQVRLVECGPEFLEVVGVVGDTRAAPGSDEDSVAYLPNLRWTRIKVNFVLRLADSGGATLRQLGTMLRRREPALVIDRLTAVDDVRHVRLAMPRVSATSASVHALLALLLSAIGSCAVCVLGLYAARSEFKIRAALGASPQQLTRRVVAQYAPQTAAGVVVGAILAWTVVRRVSGAWPMDSLEGWLISVAGSGFVLAATTAAIASTAWRLLRSNVVDGLQIDL